MKPQSLKRQSEHHCYLWQTAWQGEALVTGTADGISLLPLANNMVDMKDSEENARRHKKMGFDRAKIHLRKTEWFGHVNVVTSRNGETKDSQAQEKTHADIFRSHRSRSVHLLRMPATRVAVIEEGVLGQEAMGGFRGSYLVVLILFF